MGAIGYFPSYTLGAVMACQFFEAAKNAVPDLEENLANGNFEPLKTWLNREVRLSVLFRERIFLQHVFFRDFPVSWVGTRTVVCLCVGYVENCRHAK